MNVSVNNFLDEIFINNKSSLKCKLNEKTLSLNSEKIAFILRQFR